MNDTRLTAQILRVRTMAGILGVIGALLLAWGGMTNPHQFFLSYLFAYLFWLGLALGSLCILMIHHMTGGQWAFVIRRPLEAAAMTLPILALLFIPILFGLNELYPWANPAKVASDPVLQNKHAYLNPTFFMARAVLFFGCWIMLAVLLNRWSFEQDRTNDPSPSQRLRKLSGPGVVAYSLTLTFAAVDWLMSLEADWYSTIFGVLIGIGQILSALAFGILLLFWLSRHPPLSSVVKPSHYHHLGNLTLTFVMFWTYIAISQLIIVWSGNLPREIAWYLHRITNGWRWAAVFLAVFHFGLPFFLLLSRFAKRDALILTRPAAVILSARLADIFWMVQPAHHPQGIHLHWMDFTAPIGLGGIWMAVFTTRLKNHPLLPRNDPRMSQKPLHAS